TNCAIFINPTNAQDLVIHGSKTWGAVLDGSELAFGDYFHTRDGGQTWTKLTLPDNASPNQFGRVVISQIAWAETTLFVSTVFISQAIIATPLHSLAKSVNGGPLEWADQALPSLFPSEDTNRSIDQLFGVGKTLFAEKGCDANTACILATTED